MESPSLLLKTHVLLMVETQGPRFNKADAAKKPA